MAHPPVWFLRHGETEWNATRRIQGQLESQLSECGRWHAAEQGRILSPILAERPDCIVSPLLRAQETAEIALGDYPRRTDPMLMEIHAGAWQGLLYDDVLADWPDLVSAEMSALELFSNAPEGEGLEAFTARVTGVLDALTRPTVIVAHGLWGQIARAHLLGLDAAARARLDNLQGVVYALVDGQETVLRAPV